ncbi:hypothetical protein CLV28_1998 [Sediminihabitans luteus]|uniref:Spore protein YkvP/CgeB glycosyl transferase-like domain-containing protein n=1 Tax=Sediminihabitans luteus TaxID=1138585 RepID=A0A2M9CE56_9CELL|nr:glycosyltransferase [Sediminihabitans luteus]PJJ70169.1 hypothetical protein CLV28_1998 [Sediminihabitans luteus]GII97640.1 hypothetical protein Slu03_00180 [Sediminihabitans luteus]
MRAGTRRGAVAIVAALLALLVALDHDAAWVPALVVGLLVVGLGLGLEAVLLGRRAGRRQAELAARIAHNHERASVWNHHLERALGIDRDAVVPEPAPAPDSAATGPDRWDDAPGVVPGRTSIVIEAQGPADGVLRALAGVAASDTVPGRTTEVVVVHRTVAEPDRARARAAVGETGGTYLPLPDGTPWDVAVDAGILRASGDVVVLLRGGGVLRGGALASLVRALDDADVRAAQALAVDHDERILAAGLVQVDRRALPVRLLAGLSPDDARGLDGARPAAVSSVASAWRTSELRALRGFRAKESHARHPDDADVDLCRRARETFGGSVLVLPAARASVPPERPSAGGPGRDVRAPSEVRGVHELDALLDRCGFVAAHLDPGDGRSGPSPVLVRAPARPRRWGVVVASTPGSAGDTWGDTHVGESLRRALVAQGDEAVVHRAAAAASGAPRFDDVVLVVRGTRRVRPVPGRINVLWVISHPEDVTPDEVAEFDLVLAASESWSARTSRATGREVHVMHQATDASVFGTDVPPVPSDLPIFVGGAHVGRERPVVDVAERAGVRIAVHGEGWTAGRGRLAVHGPYIPNHELCARYRGAPLVLADHWSSMAREGFVQNRVFDALASGARVVSDPVVGMRDLLGDAVRTYDSPGEFARLCDPAGADLFGSLEQREEVARWVRREHSFDARARRLMSLVDATEEVASWR